MIEDRYLLYVLYGIQKMFFCSGGAGEISRWRNHRVSEPSSSPGRATDQSFGPAPFHRRFPSPPVPVVFPPA